MPYTAARSAATTFWGTFLILSTPSPPLPNTAVPPQLHGEHVLAPPLNAEDDHLRSVKDNANATEIKKRYYKLSLQLHPVRLPPFAHGNIHRMCCKQPLTEWKFDSDLPSTHLVLLCCAG